MKIATTLIVKNEEKNIAHVLESALQFSSDIYVVDTGSTDLTVDIIKSFNDDKIHLDYFEWTYCAADARNYALSLVQDADYTFWCDGDEKFEDEFIRRLVEFSKEEYSDDLPDIYNYWMRTVSVFAKSKTESPLYERNGILKTNKNFKFFGVVHETISINYGITTIDSERFSGLMLTNYYDKTGIAIYRNIEAFSKLSLKEHFNCRTWFYAAKEYFDLNMPVAAILFLNECIFYDDWTTEMIDGLIYYNIIYNEYESCRKISVGIEEVVRRGIINKNVRHKGVLLIFGNTLYKFGYYELAIECLKLARETQHNNVEPIVASASYDEEWCLELLINCYRIIGDNENANYYNSLLLMHQFNS